MFNVKRFAVQTILLCSPLFTTNMTRQLNSIMILQKLKIGPTVEK